MKKSTIKQLTKYFNKMNDSQVVRVYVDLFEVALSYKNPPSVVIVAMDLVLTEMYFRNLLGVEK